MDTNEHDPIDAVIRESIREESLREELNNENND